MKVILTRDVPRVGKDGEIVVVANGYARNYLFSRQLAVPARGAAIREHQNRIDREISKAQEQLTAAKQNSEKIQGSEVVVIVRTAPKSTRLFGSVTEADVAETIESTLGVSVDKRKINLIDPIKITGTYPLSVKLHPDVVASFTLYVLTEEQNAARLNDLKIAAEKAAAEAAQAETATVTA